MTPDEVTEQILGAWDELETEASSEETVEEPAEETVVEPVEEDEDDDDDESEEETEEPEAPEGEDDEDKEDDGEAEPEEDVDPEVQAFLAKYDGDVDKALKGAAGLYHVVGRKDSEKVELGNRVAELEAELQRVAALSGGGNFVDEEQRAWIEEGVASPNPGAYVNGAIQAGEFQLARVFCQEWAREDPFQAMRAVQFVDQAEAQIQVNPALDGPIDSGILLNVLAQNYPDMREHEGQMVAILNRLGPGHPLVQDAQSGELDRAARGIVGIYEIARASSTTVKSARDGVKSKKRQEAQDVRQAAQVTSASTSPSTTERPRTTQLGPGLTLEALEAEFARQ